MQIWAITVFTASVDRAWRWLRVELAMQSKWRASRKRNSSRDTSWLVRDSRSGPRLLSRKTRALMRPGDRAILGTRRPPRRLTDEVARAEDGSRMTVLMTVVLI